MSSDNEYMRLYMGKRYHQKMAEIRLMLGGKCSRCDSIVRLEIDHIDRADKSFTLGKMWSLSTKKLELELKKCQLLCKSCHSKKTMKDTGKKSARGTHGTLSAY